NGKLEKNPIFRDSGLSSQLPKDSEGSLSPKPSANLDVPPQTAKPDSTTTPLKIEANPAFGENFAEYAGKGAEAVKKLLEEKRGQVSGAFYRPDLGESGGYIDLIWGSVEGKGKEAKGLGLSKIVEKHIEDFSPFEGNTPLEKLASGLNEIINKGEFKAQENTSATIKYTKDGNLFRVGLRQNWMGEPTKNKWVITAYKDEREASKIIDSKGFTGGETLPPDPKADSTTTPLKIEANPAFGENFAEYAGKGAEAVKKLLEEKRGQVSGAFYRQDLGYIDLVWGNYELKAAPGAKKPKSYGLSKILEKHAKDFESFKGADVGEKVVNGITEIIERGELKEKDGVKTLYLYNEFGEFKVGLSKGWNKKGDNTWVITAYKVRTPPAQLSDQAQLNKDMGYSSPKGEHDPSVEASKSQGNNSDSLTKGETLPPNPKPDSTTTPLKTEALNTKKTPKLDRFEEERAQDLLERLKARARDFGLKMLFYNLA
ncbi:putative barnase/colicin E5 family endoribonuclease, partial [Helicobacter ailurogastricus]|uniref:putative barnase/colicin E5 family endoribonuclease n=1 Tax=Helicobacter ailurogastricus TaxID=1578720 RepID=UPI002490DD8C